MKKLLLVGSSLFVENHFNFKINNITDKDEYPISDMCAKLGDFSSTKTVAINAAGNQWTAAAVINQLKEIDANTHVIVQWSGIDRWDMFLPSSKNNEDLGFNDINSLPEHLRNDPVFTNTHDLEGKPTDTGFRVWITGAMYLGKKFYYRKNYFSWPDAFKSSCESIALVQKLIEETGATQQHMIPWDYTRILERDIIKHFALNLTDQNNYVPVELPSLEFNVLEAYPILKVWHNMIDWSTVPETHLEFFHRNKLPSWCGRMDHAHHPLPLINYFYIKDQYFPNSKVDLLDEVMVATKRHCEKYNVNLDFNSDSIKFMINRLKGAHNEC